MVTIFQTELIALTVGTSKGLGYINVDLAMCSQGVIQDSIYRKSLRWSDQTYEKLISLLTGHFVFRNNLHRMGFVSQTFFIRLRNKLTLLMTLLNPESHLWCKKGGQNIEKNIASAVSFKSLKGRGDLRYDMPGWIRYTLPCGRGRHCWLYEDNKTYIHRHDEVAVPSLADNLEM